MSQPDLAALKKAADEAAAALAADPENPELQAAADAAAKALADAQPPTETKEKLIELRVLLDHLGHKVDDVIKLPVAEAKAAVTAGWADDHKDAVAFAKAQAKGN